MEDSDVNDRTSQLPCKIQSRNNSSNKSKLSLVEEKQLKLMEKLEEDLKRRVNNRKNL